MTRRVRLLIGAVALVAGVAIFWVSVSLWTRDQIYARDGLAAACLHDGDADRLVRDPPRFRRYLAATVSYRTGVVTHPPGMRTHLARILIDRFGFLFVPEEEYVHLIETMRTCGAPPVSS